MACKLTKKEAAALFALAEAYEQSREALADRLDEIASKWEEEVAEKSERWQESEAGQEAQARAEMMRTWFDEMPEEGTPEIDTDSLL